MCPFGSWNHSLYEQERRKTATPSLAPPSQGWRSSYVALWGLGAPLHSPICLEITGEQQEPSPAMQISLISRMLALDKTVHCQDEAVC